MSVDNRTKPDPSLSTRLLRTQLQGAEAAKAIKTTGTLSHTQTSNERDANPVEKLFELDQFAKLSQTQQARQDQVKKDLQKVASQGDKIKEYAKEQYHTAGNNAQAVAAQLIINLAPDVLKFLKKADDKGDLANLNPKEFEAKVDHLLEDPDQLPYIMKDVLTSDMEAKRKELQNDPEKLAELDAKEAQLKPIFSALSALENNGSHEEMFAAIENLNKQDMTPRLKGLVKNYMNSLVEIGRAQQHHLGITLQNENSFLSVNGVDPRVDKREYRRLYARMGGMIADRNGGIAGAGQVYNFMEAAVVHAGDPYEYKLGQDTDLDVRRLVDRLLQPAQNRTYTGVALNEQNPSPRYVYVDSEIQIQGDLPFDNNTKVS
jgi:hypothetical protein